MTKQQYADDLAAFAGQIQASLYAAADRFGKEFNVPGDKIYAEIMQKLVETVPQSVQNAGDKRSTAYRVRLTLFHNGGLEADTDPELALNAPGGEIIFGLQSVGDWAREITQAFHGSLPIGGLDEDDIKRSIKSLRPSLSRNNGTHNWRLNYTVNGEEGFSANILVVTVTDEDAIS